jgi:hypothetical protein
MAVRQKRLSAGKLDKRPCHGRHQGSDPADMQVAYAIRRTGPVDGIIEQRIAIHDGNPDFAWAA